MKALLFVSFLILLVNSFETDVSLEGRDRIRIVSEFRSLPIIVVSSDDIPKGTASVIVGSGPSVQLNDVSSSVRGDFLEIRITGTEDLSEFSSSSDSSSSSILKPFSCFLVMISLAFCCFMGKRQYMIMVIALSLLATAYASDDQRIVVTFSFEENIQDLEISSPSPSVIVTPELVGDCTFGDDECWSMVCSVDDDDCISDQFVHIGVLLPFEGDKGDQYLQTLYLAANRYGTAVPLVQMIVADSGDSADGALAAARELVQHGCEYFVGPLFSGQAHEVLDYLEDQRKGQYSMISPEASSTELEQYDNFFSLFAENNDLAIAICQYSIYLMDPVEEVVDMYIVGLETEYVNNLISLLGSECGIQFNLEFVEQYPESANSAADMQNVVRSLNDALGQADNLDYSLVVHLGFSELRFLLEALEDEGGLAKRVHWVSSDSTFDDSSIPTPLRENEDFGPLPLMGLQYLGFHVDNSIEVRNELLRRVFQETGSVSFDITFVHDAAMLMYLTLEKMGTLVEEHALFPSSLKSVSEISYGASGYLRLSDVGFRDDNEFLIGVAIPPDASFFNSIWIAERFLKSVGSGTFSNRNYFVDTVKYLFLETLKVSCDDYTIVGQTFDYLGRPIDFEFSIEETENDLYIPLFFPSSFDVTCSDSKRIQVSCPPNARESFIACRSLTESIDKSTQNLPPSFLPVGTQATCNNQCPPPPPPPFFGKEE